MSGLFGTNWLPRVTKDEDEVGMNNKRGMLAAINNTISRNQIFQGSDVAKKQRNRRKNKAARAARRAHRR